MPSSFLRISKSLPFSRFFRQLEEEVETVVKVLQPGPLGIIEHKFSVEEIREAKAGVYLAVQNWKRNAAVEKQSNIMKDHIDI
ncbi:Zinc metalloproteinase aureolysin [Thalictrum thalictroides]|uniref:Zinc metalloproteinase aureolysin n=1 Tax=Thalictrum thalictroides TaxID=46969 RepID=A0A7J6X6G7_THATH|nr:Zinc metalloproteinase aureolysin [Thalictrum thalictroides]